MHFLVSISSLLLISTFSPASAAKADLRYPPTSFFDTEDVTGVTWAHGVNSQAALDQTLADPTIRMIEADLSRGYLNQSGTIIPREMVIMAHPPTNVSDLSFTSFIDQVMAFNEGKSLEEMKGVKLDFKDYFSAAFSILALGQRNNTNPLRFPVWLNADVVKGPVFSGSEPKIDGVDFLKLHASNLPNAVLSLGWTTRFGPQSDGGVITEGSYTRAEVDDMINVFRRFTANEEVTRNLPVTFAVRAAIAQNSVANLLYLMNATSHRASLTLWTGADDPKVDIALMADMFKLVGTGRVFVDLPYPDWEAAKETTSGGNGSRGVVTYSGILLSFLIVLKGLE